MLDNQGIQEADYITQSKNDCAARYMDPNRIMVPQIIMSELELAKKKADYEEILEVVSFFSKKILKSFEGIPILIVISDEKGYLLDMAGDESIKTTLNQVGISTGLKFTQEDTGTNVVSLTLQQGHPVQLIGENHYHTFLHTSACYGVPFNYTDVNKLLGSICIMTAVILHNPFFLTTLATVVDALERELLLKKQNKQLDILNQIMISKTRNGIVVTDEVGIVSFYNEYVEKISGYDKESVIGRNVCTSEITGEYFKEVLQSNKQFNNVELKFENGNNQQTICLFDAQPIHDEKDQIIGAFGQFRDITERYLEEEKYNYLAYHDELTGLANRRFLREKLNEHIKNNDKITLMFLDLDKFKMINDTFGHSKGDILIQEVANMLLKVCSKSTFVSRVGGDEFIIIYTDLTRRDEVVTYAQNIISAFNRTFIIENLDLHITPSIGVVQYEDNKADAEQLLVYADNAMYKAKANGRNGYVIYDSGIEISYKDKLTFKMLMEKALEKEEFSLQYQPQIDTKTKEIVGVEALIRWTSAEKGSISPAQFIPIAEETGLIEPIGEWVLRTACSQMKKWVDMGKCIKMSVNLSIHQFLKSSLVDTIRSILEETKLEPRYLEVEITESMTMDVEYAIQQLNELNSLGVSISIDDFGTGYSSLNYLKRFRIQSLKIDRSFVKDIMTDVNDASIVSTVISMAHNLNLKVVAEGVETKEQFDFLQSQDCDFIQGFYFSRPISSDDIETKFFKD